MERDKSTTALAYANYTSPPAIFAFSTILIASILIVFACKQSFPNFNSIQHTLSLPKFTYRANHQAKEKARTQWHKMTIRKGDTLSKIFQKYHLPAKDIQEILTLGPITQTLVTMYPYHQLDIGMDQQQQLVELIYSITPTKKLVIARHANHFTAKIKKEKLEPHVHFANATIHQSLYTAAKRAHLKDNLVYELINNFAWDIDFAQDIRSGDRFVVLYNDYYIGDQKVQGGDILAATFKTQNKTFKIVRYTNPAGHTAYYTPSGHSVKTAFIHTPVKYTRISSPFNPNRFHPILHRLHAHKGVDYAAPKNTPVKSTGDGKIIKQQRLGGYGNVIMIRHGSRYTTVYGHLSRFVKALHVGSHVKQGQTIAYVGQTGLATGPHLHYEFRINGKHVNPVNVKLPRARPISRKYRKDFFAKTKTLLAELALYDSVSRNT